MASAQRVSDEPAFILHRYDWSESSLILEVFTRHRGRVALVAKGAKKHTSNFRPVLLGLQPLRLSYTLAGSSSADIHTLRGAEWAGGHIMPMGARLLSGLYINELLLRLLARDDPYAYVFDVYAALIKLLATQHDVVQEPALRAFELILLRELGLLPSLHAQTLTLQPLAPQAPYTLAPRSGPAPRRTGRAGGADRPAMAHLGNRLAIRKRHSLPPSCKPAPTWPRPSSRNCAPCCNFIAEVLCCAHAS